ncbi:hypothetical protein A2892_01215 [Candidatus Woesebacteria bacterium RIFCSPLOWO2_01_FULL_39_10b]|uniref:Glycosyltransferase RgtA/B/C/D-like domain-containing protein n=1 Tax=Candidatus Woesebacteria bacterium RIFCSPLOWO2_01_FULL_39_10b TaxID=1802517 RepID=A0A1F8BAE3_9BACT|nr:MAG: hypothetical protein A2892_01215 [Candidatus Woesebacteria bacterium RIFCSPLOWO2_01_FULL_39_10b]
MEKVKIVISHQLSVIRRWIFNNRKEFYLLILILLLGAFLRLYKIADYMTFLGDEGRDAIIVRRLLVDFDPILIGPRTSIGDMYLGPLYYYMMAPALLLAGFNPVGPAIMVALLGAVTIFLVWYVARLWFGDNFNTSKLPKRVPCVGALIAAFLYSISPVVITYSKSSWNPNIMPFFALLSILGIWKVWFRQEFKWLIVVGVSMAFVLQSHYLGLLLLPTLGIFWTLTLFEIRNTKSETGKLIKYSFLAVVFFAFLMSPLVIFDARHYWRNFNSMKLFFTERQSTISLKAWRGFPNTWPIFKDSFVTRIVSGKHLIIGKYTALVLLLTAICFIGIKLKKIFSILANLNIKNIKNEEARFISGFIILVFWIFIGILGMSVYKQHIYDHYFGFLFPAPFLLIAGLSQIVYTKFADGAKILLTAGIILLSVANIINTPIRYEPNYQMQRAINVSDLIREKAMGKMFNLAVIAERNYEDGYQYFLEKEEAKVVDIDPLRAEETIANQLFVICELLQEQCDPTRNPKAEVANFGWSRIEGEWRVVEVTIYKLVHTEI